MVSDLDDAFSLDGLGSDETGDSSARGSEDSEEEESLTAEEIEKLKEEKKYEVISSLFPTICIPKYSSEKNFISMHPLISVFGKIPIEISMLFSILHLDIERQN